MKCNTPLEVNAKFCVWCGIRLPESPESPASPTSPTSPIKPVITKPPASKIKITTAQMANNSFSAANDFDD
ncbi:MAG: hypothetical protein IKL87_03885 [Oscillospiraceae bacterium]|nr:hypothetical protein [Oscillospiraceae bacterium]